MEKKGDLMSAKGDLISAKGDLMSAKGDLMSGQFFNDFIGHLGKVSIKKTIFYGVLTHKKKLRFGMKKIRGPPCPLQLPKMARKFIGKCFNFFPLVLMGG